MQKETKEILCTACISFLAGVTITLMIFGCATHMAHLTHKAMGKCPYSQQMNSFKHHNKLMGRKPPLLVIPAPQETPKKQPITP